jgi:hypothetical protein
LDLGASQLGLALMRIVYHATVFWLIFDLWYWREIAFFGHVQSAIPFLLGSLAVNALLVLGFKTRPLLILNWVLLRVIFRKCRDPYTVEF